jgi:hypothetical protein
MKYSYPHVEDYIEFIAGFKDAAGKFKYSIFQLPESPLNLARYDVKIVESFAEQAHNGIGFTDKQADLAVALILKYERQLAKHSIDIELVKTTPTFRIPMRNIDRTTRVWVEDNMINIRFPYDQDLIDLIRNESKESSGRIHFNRDSKVWQADLTEYNVNLIFTFSKNNNFIIDKSLCDLMNLILEVEKIPHKIELTQDQQGLRVTNAADSLVEYIQQTLGGFDHANLLRLLDHAPLLGYTADPAIEQSVIKQYGTRFWSLCTNRELRVDRNASQTDQVQELIAYATITNRFPIYLYEPDQSSRITSEMISYFDQAQIANLGNREEITADTRLVYTNKIPRKAVDRIPLLVSSAGMLFGGDRQVWIQTAEKVVYFTNDVYNKNVKKGRDICKLD